MSAFLAYIPGANEILHSGTSPTSIVGLRLDQLVECLPLIDRINGPVFRFGRAYFTLDSTLPLVCARYGRHSPDLDFLTGLIRE